MQTLPVTNFTNPISSYHVASVNKASSPDGKADGNWYRYVLAGGRSPITGLRRGTLSEVTEHAKRCVRDLNDRNSGKRLSAWSTRRARAAAATS
ncbi:hypothetical protein TI03_00800 [Achromatium sp. WMS1]|nr:hypothetical protein TI03_00800 [Achromatium sp. WMS1]